MLRIARVKLSALAVLLYACGCSDSRPVAPPAPQQILTKVSGDSQISRVGEPVPNPLVVKLATSVDAPVAGAIITFEIITGIGTLQSPTAITGVTGTAEARLTFGREIGAVTVRARSLTNAEVTFTATPQTGFPFVYAGTSHTCARAGPAGMYCWGANSEGQVGDGTVTSRQYPRPVAITSDSSFGVIAAGSMHTCAVTVFGTALCWGTNTLGQLGDGTTTQRLSPVAVASPGGVRYTNIDVGRNHSCGTVPSGAIYCWGSNSSLQLGDGTGSMSTAPRRVVQPDGVALMMVAAGDSHTCAKSSVDRVYCWGENISGATSHIPTHVAMPGGVAVLHLDAGGRHTCAHSITGAMYCWGANDRGQLGIGTTFNQTEPTAVQLPSLVTVQELRLGDRHSCFRGTNRVYCWGANDKGQLGDGTTIDRAIPTLVSLPAGVTVTGLTAGGNHSCATTFEGAYCWGANASGQLGDDSTLDRALPVRVRTQ